MNPDFYHWHVNFLSLFWPGWLLVVLGFNATLTAEVIIIMAVGDAYVFPGFLTPVLTQLFFPKPQSQRLLFSHASAEVRGENTPERKVASTRDRTHNHQVMSPTHSPLSQPGGAIHFLGRIKNNNMLTLWNWLAIKLSGLV